MTLVQCRHYGLSRVYKIGCPSNFINDDLSFPDKLRENTAKQHFDRVTLNRGYFDSKVLRHDNILRSLIYQHDGSRFVVQTNDKGLIAIALGRTDEVDAASISYLRKKYQIARIFGRTKMFNQFSDTLQVYLDMEQWLSDAAGWDITLGTRIHGAMASIQAGTPAILTTIDSRTLGLAKQMRLPYIPISAAAQWKPGIKPRALLNQAQFSVEQYLQRRAILAPKYVAHLNEFGLNLSQRILRLA